MKSTEDIHKELDLISNAIKHLDKNSGSKTLINSFLLWGISVCLVASLGLLFPDMANVFWTFTMPIVFLINIWIVWKNKPVHYTPVFYRFNLIVWSSLWLSIGWSCFISQKSGIPFPVFIFFFLSLGVLITGLVYKFIPFIVGALILCGASVMILLVEDMTMRRIITIAAILAGYIIPSLLFKKTGL